jgi:hypothetical protein
MMQMSFSFARRLPFFPSLVHVCGHRRIAMNGLWGCTHDNASAQLIKAKKETKEIQSNTQVVAERICLLTPTTTHHRRWRRGVMLTHTHL